ncbi:uncharacterized protein LOC117784764 isoform X2 [Drosophila innubila]|uniref:uncharacterized protein LOC117784764 isoform X2 n=1 Tax=Drosophila innubila TaxID=198719 RepID=UPI00148BEEEE|nr:uncharacterized protein LOC117784764 isoform X2 [Drosophila innubila]
MTFYWWSHWFWITCLSVQLLPNGITTVETYPSQDISQESTTQLEGQAADRLKTVDHDADAHRQTTKLYQTTASQTWATATQTNIMDLTIKTTATSKVTHSYTEDGQLGSADVMESPLSDSPDDDGVELHRDEIVEIDENRNDDKEETIEKMIQSHNQFEFKRSADFAVVSPAEQLNNYTNFSRSTSTNTNKNNNISGCSVCNFTSTAAAGSSRRPEDSSITTVETSTTKTSTSTESPLLNSSTGQTVAATPSTPKINTDWLSDELQKAPFTLQNAKKEDELHRAETDHRSRKSKVLSAEYKHINRYINFSSDTKSLLTRSASATPSVSGYNPDEGNISSEALAIQVSRDKRQSYFLDAGTISALCFTVFGICCTVGTIGIVLYRRRYLNKPQALSEPDSSVYIDDSTMRDNSDEMYSLDNDSFLNSLEAMTIQNYWTDTVKHTKL